MHGDSHDSRACCWFFQTIAYRASGLETKFYGLAFESIEQNVSWLERPFKETKVHDVVRKMVKDKALVQTDFLWVSSNHVGKC